MLRATAQNLGGGPRQGASTITMQLARTIYLGQAPTLTRKLREMVTASAVNVTGELNVSRTVRTIVC